MTIERIMNRVEKSGALSQQDILDIRRTIFPDGVVEREEAIKLFHLHHMLKAPCEEWSDFFCEAMLDHLVYQQEPRGFVEEDDAAWFMDALLQDGFIDTQCELTLLIRVLEVARSVPEALQVFALEQVRLAVLYSKGIIAKDKSFDAHSINHYEVALLRRILFAPAGDGPLGITKNEAEILFELNDYHASSKNDPEWYDLFAKSIAHYIMSAFGHIMPMRSEALKRSAWLDGSEGLDWSLMAHREALSSALKGGLRSMMQDFFGGSASEEAYMQQNEARHYLFEQGFVLEDGEIDWLYARLMRDGLLSPAEEALLDFLEEEHGAMPKRLRALLVGHDAMCHDKKLQEMSLFDEAAQNIA